LSLQPLQGLWLPACDIEHSLTGEPLTSESLDAVVTTGLHGRIILGHPAMLLGACGHWKAAMT
jgi:hypothetical protein